jgi:hypothetical protein
VAVMALPVLSILPGCPLGGEPGSFFCARRPIRQRLTLTACRRKLYSPFHLFERARPGEELMSLPAKSQTAFNISQASSPGVCNCHWAIRVTCLVCLTAFAGGCKTGSSMSSSWLGLGMGGPDPATLAEAPPFEGDTSKPSAAAKPYPTTSTPESYAVEQNALPESAGQVAAAAPQSPVTYGSTPPASGQTAMAPSAMASATPSAQVGPYQQVPAPTTQPSAASPAGIPAAAAMASDAAAGYGQPSSRFSQASPVTASPSAGLGSQPNSRFSSIADQRVAESQSTAASATAAFGSRYGSAPPAVPASTVPAESGQFTTTPAAGRYGEAMSSAFGGVASGSNMSTAAPPVLNPPAAMPSTAIPPAASSPEPAEMPEQPAGPIGEGLPAPPTSRRPDPGYRPGGTGSYRPAQPIYADAPLSVPTTVAASGEPSAEERVTPASFEAEFAAPRQLQP